MTTPTWTAPTIARPREPFVAAERPMLQGWLDRHRHTLLAKCAGLTPDQLKTASVPPSNLTLLGLLRHMAEVERGWFRGFPSGAPIADIWCTPERPEADFEDVADADAEADYAAFIAETEAARAAVAELDLDATFTNERGIERNLRWVFIHMIEEYARHNGHADLIRERIDGVTGD